MKYSEKNKPLVCMQTNNMCYKNTREMEVLGILWHSTAANNPKLSRYVQPLETDENYEEMIKILGDNPYNNDWNHTNRKAGLNFWIGKLANGSVAAVQTMPWNYRPWGCGEGENGSCNNGWIQFEICEDGLTDRNYFEAVYNEACEMTAYLCKMFNIDPKGTVEVNGVKVPTILCHQDSYRLGMGSDHDDIYHWFPKFGKDMDDVRDAVAALLRPAEPAPAKKYNIGDAVRVKEGSKWESGKTISSWVFDSKMYVREYKDNDSVVISTQLTGATTGTINESCLEPYKVSTPIINKPKPVDKAEPEVPTLKASFEIGDEVTVVKGATWASGKTISSWVFDSKMYVRSIQKDGIVISTLKTGATTGTIDPKYLKAYIKSQPVEETNKFIPYTIKVTANRLNVRKGPGTAYDVCAIIKKDEAYRIIEEHNGWGRINKGWISLKYAKKV